MVALNEDVVRRAQAVAEVLSREGVVRAGYVFGSRADGRGDEWSDLDVAVFMDGVEGWDIQRCAQAIGRVMSEVGPDVEAHLFPSSALRAPAQASFAEYVQRHGVRFWPQ